MGDTHPSTATKLNNLAALYQSQGRYGEAEPLYRSALAIFMQTLGENHPCPRMAALEGNGRSPLQWQCFLPSTLPPQPIHHGFAAAARIHSSAFLGLWLTVPALLARRMIEDGAE